MLGVDCVHFSNLVKFFGTLIKYILTSFINKTFRMRGSPLVLLVILCSAYNGKAQNYYACPTLSICVLPKLCPSQKITFDVGSSEQNLGDSFEKYVCGVLEETDGFVCCSDPKGIPADFKPNETTWYFLDDDAERKEKLDIRIVPYPGLKNFEGNSGEGTIFLCPIQSACVHGELCPREAFAESYSEYVASGTLEEFSCGKTIPTHGFVCCPIKTLVKDLKLTEDDSAAYKFLQNKHSQKSSYDGYLELADDELSSARRVPIFFDLQKFGTARDKGKLSLPVAEVIRNFTGRSTEYGGPWECGHSLKASLENARVFAPVGNRTAKEGDFPWHVAILSTSYKYLCSGVIVGEKIVLTAAHCVDDIIAEKILIRVGDVDLINDFEVNTAFDVPVSLLVVHPDYDKIQLIADIAVIELQVSLRTLPYIRPVCLPKNFRPSINQCKVAGWGQFTRSQEESRKLSPMLREASFVIIENGNCQNSLRKSEQLGPFFKLQEAVLCAKGVSNADTCKGDGGGGLVCRDKDVYVLKGLVSYGIGCGLNWPGVYTDVAKFLDFIENYRAFSKLNKTAESTFTATETPSVKTSEYHISEVANDHDRNDIYISHERKERPHEESDQSSFKNFIYDKPSGQPHTNIKQSFQNDRIFYSDIPKHHFEFVGKQNNQIHKVQLQNPSSNPFDKEPTRYLERPLYEEPIDQHYRPIYEEYTVQHDRHTYKEPNAYDSLVYTNPFDRPIYEENSGEHDRSIYKERTIELYNPIFEDSNQYDHPKYEESTNHYDEPDQQLYNPLFEDAVHAHTRPSYAENIRHQDQEVYEDPFYQNERLIYEGPVRRPDPSNYEEISSPHDRIFFEEFIGPNDIPNNDQTTFKGTIYIPDQSQSEESVGGRSHPVYEDPNNYYDRVPSVDSAYPNKHGGLKESIKHDGTQHEGSIIYNDPSFYDERSSYDSPSSYQVPISREDRNFYNSNFNEERVEYNSNFNEESVEYKPHRFSHTFKRPTLVNNYSPLRLETEKKYLSSDEPSLQKEEHYNPSKLSFNRDNFGNYENSFKEAFYQESQEKNAPLSFLRQL